MKQKVWFGIIFLFLFSCNNQKNSVIDLDVIDIEYGLENLTRLKVSDFGQTIRYIPLETHDDGLVGNNPVIKVLKNYIVVEAQRKCLLFDKKDGSFIAEIGHYGQDPEAYTDHFSWTDEKEEFLYFARQPNQLMKYDMQGKFCGKVEFASPPGLASYFLVTDSEIIGFYGVTTQFYVSTTPPTNQFALRIFERDGSVKDSIPPFYQKTQIVADEIAGMTVIRNRNLFGNKAGLGLIIIDYKNDTREFNFPYSPSIWKHNENIRYKEDFVDTVYTVSGAHLTPSFIFNTGRYHWPVEERTSKKNTNERIYISDVSENNTFVFFQCIRGMQSDEPVLYNGLYRKQTGQTKLSRSSDEIEDDLTRFMPFTPSGISTAGEFVSLVEAWKVMEWLEEHPEAMNNENLSFLKELDDEMNPILILVE